MWSFQVRIQAIRFATVVTALGMAVVWAAPAGASSNPDVQISASVVSGSSQTIRYDDPGPGQVMFDQRNQLTVEGTFGNRPLEGTLDYRLQVLLPSPGAPAEFLNATTQSATFTSNQGDLSSETSWYAIPVIGFECLTTNPVECMDHNAVVLAFGAGSGNFSTQQDNRLWTLRAAHDSADGVVTDGTLTGGLGLGFRYCDTGQATTVPSPAEGTYRTSTSLTPTRTACFDELGNRIPKNTVAGAAPDLEYAFNWSATLNPPDNPVLTLYPDRSATAWNAAGTMTGVVGSVFMQDFPPEATGEALMLGGPWGELTGVFSSYKYALVRSYNITEAFEGAFPLGVRTISGQTVAILAVY